MSETENDPTEFKREPDGDVNTVSKAQWFKVTTRDGAIVFYNGVVEQCWIEYDGPLMEVKP